MTPPPHRFRTHDRGRALARKALEIVECRAERRRLRVVVEQEAVSRMMMFSKRVRLVLEITEDPGTIRFHDRCGGSFAQYEGTWRVVARNHGSEIFYELTARPAFDVPEFILKGLLKRDAGRMIERLAREMARRLS